MKLFVMLLACFVTIAQARNLNLNFKKSTDLKPVFDSHFYVDQGLRYFDSIDSYADRKSKPLYSKNVIRWEWYPWLRLTGHKRKFMKLDVLLKLYPTRVINRDCRFFEIQPFARCRVSFEYNGDEELVDIYEEFTFNDHGEITFVEAWSDIPGLLPMDAEIDPWAEGENVHRLSTKVPGLGRRDRPVRANDKEMRIASRYDSDVKDLRRRMKFPVLSWIFAGLQYLVEYH